jgi:CBS domain-containing protein
MQIIDMMTPTPQAISPDATLQQAARLMDDLNVGALPVCDGERLVGILTDRDIVVRSTSAGQDPRTVKVVDTMTAEVHSCFLDTTVEEAMRMMESLQVRRIPVVDGDGRLVGIVSLGDIATEEPEDAADALERISQPSRPDR